MKRMALISMAVLALLLTQCKKKEIATTSNTGGKVHITFTPENGNSKSNYDPATGFSFKTDAYEYIYVGASGGIGYLGTLDNGGNSTSFGGSIELPESKCTLYFIYLGNCDGAGNPKDMSSVTTTASMDFWNQSEGTLTDFHIAVGSSSYTPSQTNFSATMDTKIAIAYYDLSKYSGETVFMYGDAVYNKAFIDFTTGDVSGVNPSNGAAEQGIINIGTGGSSKYIAMIPQRTPSETTVNFASVSKKGTMTFLRGIKENMLYCNNDYTGISPTTETVSLPSSVLPRLFTVYPSRMVRFSKGNLQYDNSGKKGWSLAAHQYDYLGSWTSDGMQDLFCWGQTGANGTNMGNAGSYTTRATDLASVSEWGYVAKISQLTSWRTMNKDEMNYLLVERKTVSGLRFAKAIVNGVNGLVILPDDWSTSYYTLNNTNTTTASYNTNVISGADWETYLEGNGAVFLPAAGYRNSAGAVSSAGSAARYWSVSAGSDTGHAHATVFSESALSPWGAEQWRNVGMAVRLVKNF